MGENKTSGSTNLEALKDKLLEEFENMSRMLKDEKNNFEQQMARKKGEHDAEIRSKLLEVEAERKELENNRRQLKQEKDDFAEEIARKDREFTARETEMEEKNRQYLQKIEENRLKAANEEIDRLNELALNAKYIEKENEELLKQQTDLERALEDLSQTHKKKEESHLLKMAALKKELDEIEDEIEQKLFLVDDKTDVDHSKKSRELIIKTVTGDTYRGNINIGKKERLSDMFTKGKTPFVVMYDAVYKGEEKTTVFINKQNIVFIKPLDNSVEKPLPETQGPPAEVKMSIREAIAKK